MGRVNATAKASCVLAVIVSIILGCTEDSSGDAISLTSGSAIELYPIVNQQGTVSFHASGNWTAICVADWLTFSPKKGEAGDNTITLTTTSTNRTKVTRSAQLNITSGTSRKSVTVVQSGKFAVFSNDEYVIGPEGGTLALEVTSNLEEGDALRVAYNQVGWISWPDQARLTRSEWTRTLPQLIIQPNTSTERRTTSFALMMDTSDGQRIALDTCYIHQEGYVDDYASTDYSADGTVTLMQQASQGSGIPVVMMGDGFADRDIADGTYMQVMEKTLDNLFSEEPVKSLRSYFNVYAVTAVSRNSGVGNHYSTVFSTLPLATASTIDYDEDKVDEYLAKVKGLDVENTLVIIILNGHTHNGVTYWFQNDDYTAQQFAVSLCPVIDSLQSETFRQVLTHEAIGHGLAKLADEYGYESNGPAPANEINSLNWLHRIGWLSNVDSNSETSVVGWSPFIGDSRFDNEAIGVYEGGFTYVSGIYRPTEESMMRSNQSPFNAPSRKAIYDRVMLLGEGRSTSTLDEFAAFDAEHKPQQWDYSTPSTRSHLPLHRRLAPPVVRRR